MGLSSRAKPVLRAAKSRSRREMASARRAQGLSPREMTSARRAKGLSPREMASARRAKGLSPREMTSARRAKGLSPREMTSARRAKGLSPREMASARREMGISLREMGISCAGNHNILRSSPKKAQAIVCFPPLVPKLHLGTQMQPKPGFAGRESAESAHTKPSFAEMTFPSDGYSA